MKQLPENSNKFAFISFSLYKFCYIWNFCAIYCLQLVYLKSTKTYKGIKVMVKNNHTDDAEASKTHVSNVIHLALL